MTALESALTQLVVLRPWKTCACCGRGYTESQWRALPWVGVQAVVEGEALELRNCACGTTHAMPVAEAASCAQCGATDGIDAACACHLGEDS